MKVERVALHLVMSLCFVVAVGTSATQAEDRLVGGVPLPEDTTVQIAPQGSPDWAKALLGPWIGSWDGEMRHVLVIESVAPNGASATVLSAVAGKAEWGVPRGWVRRAATIAGNTLAIEGTSPTAYVYALEPSATLQATYRQGTRRSYARLTRASIEALKAPGTALNWSEPTRTFVEGPAEDGRRTQLEVMLYTPPGHGPFPLLVFNHGSTGTGRDPASFSRSFQVFGLADFFVSQGWMVAFPQRRGRGGSSGLYDEGFSLNRAAGYTCDASIALAGAERALVDVEAAVAALRRRSDVAPGPIVIGGQSRGGALAIAFAGRHPEIVRGVVNFVGGWLGTGCGTANEVNGVFLRQGGHFPQATLWLYGRNDPYYPIGHSQANFDQFRRAGGHGRFVAIDVLSGNGHALVYDRDLWRDPMTAYLSLLEPARP